MHWGLRAYLKWSRMFCWPALGKQTWKNHKCGRVIHHPSFKYSDNRIIGHIFRSLVEEKWFFVLASFPSLTAGSLDSYTIVLLGYSILALLVLKQFLPLKYTVLVFYTDAVLWAIAVSLLKSELTWKRNVLQLGSISTLTNSVGNQVEAYNKATKHGSWNNFR